MRKILISSLLLVLIQGVFAQESDGYKRRLYQAYVKSELYLWEGIIEEMDREYEMNKDPEVLYDLCFALYGYIGYLITEEERKDAKRELRQAEKRTEELELILAGRHDVVALRGALMGYRIVISKFSSLFLGPKIQKYLDIAYESADTCFNCNTEMGSRYFYTPKLLGGSKQKAIPYYKKAVELLEQSSLKTEHSWLYLNGVLMLANAYKETEQMDLACELYEKLMEYEPEAHWIRNKLYAKCK